jgi:hypothetical protein
MKMKKIEEFYLLSCGCVIKLVSIEPFKYGYEDVKAICCESHMPFDETYYIERHPCQWDNKGTLIDKTKVAILKLQGSNNGR